MYGAVLALMLLWGVSSSAHHSVATFFDLDKTIEVKGVVKEFRLVNPHMRMVIEVTNNGQTETWTLTGGVTGDLRAAGWTPESIGIGEVVTVSGPPARNPAAKGMYVRKLVKADGKTLEQRVRD
jgi:hypothetical protein